MHRILVCVMLALSTCASCCHADVLTNGNFNQQLAGWTKDYGSTGCDDCGRSRWGNNDPGPLNDWRAICNVKSAALSQQILINPGLYNLNLAGYYMFSNPLPRVIVTQGYVRFSILADGTEVANCTRTSDELIDFRSRWSLAGVKWSGSVSKSVGVRIAMQNIYAAGPYGPEGYCVCLDDVSLNALPLPVPEPSSFLAMLSACGFMAACCRRRFFLR